MTQTQSAVTGFSSIVGAVLAAYLATRGIPVSPDQASALVASAAGAGAAIVGGAAHLIVGWFHQRNTPEILPAPAAITITSQLPVQPSFTVSVPAAASVSISSEPKP